MLADALSMSITGASLLHMPTSSCAPLATMFSNWCDGFVLFRKCICHVQISKTRAAIHCRRQPAPLLLSVWIMSKSDSAALSSLYMEATGQTTHVTTGSSQAVHSTVITALAAMQQNLCVYLQSLLCGKVHSQRKLDLHSQHCSWSNNPGKTSNSSQAQLFCQQPKKWTFSSNWST